MQVLWTGQGLGNGRLKLDVPARALKFYLPHALGEGRRQFTVLQDCALVAPGRLARYRPNPAIKIMPFSKKKKKKPGGVCFYDLDGWTWPLRSRPKKICAPPSP